MRSTNTRLSAGVRVARVRASAVFLCPLEVFLIGTCAAFSRFVLANRWGHHVQNVG